MSEGTDPREEAYADSRPHDAVLGWVEKLGRDGDVAVHPTVRAAVEAAV